MGYGKEGKTRGYDNPFDVVHWKCPCGQPNAMDRDQCLACEKVPKEKITMQRGGRPPIDAKYGLVGSRDVQY